MKSPEQSRSPSRDGASNPRGILKHRSRSPRDPPNLQNTSPRVGSASNSDKRNISSAGSDGKGQAQQNQNLVERAQSPSDGFKATQEILKFYEENEENLEEIIKRKAKRKHTNTKDYLESAIEKVLPLLDRYQGYPYEIIDCAKINKNVAKLGRRILVPQGAGLSKLINKTKIQKSLKYIEELNEIEVSKMRHNLKENTGEVNNNHGKNELIKKDYDYNMDNPLIDDNGENKAELMNKSLKKSPPKLTAFEKEKLKLTRGYFTRKVKLFPSPGYIKEDSDEMERNSSHGNRSALMKHSPPPIKQMKSFSPNERNRKKYMDNVKIILDNCKGIQEEYGQRQKLYIDALSKETQEAMTKLLVKMNKV